jgi:hypothetical protein
MDSKIVRPNRFAGFLRQAAKGQSFDFDFQPFEAANKGSKRAPFLKQPA